MMKEQVRKQALARRNALDKATVKAHSEVICEALKPYVKGTIGIYLPYGNEVDVTPLCNASCHIFAIPKTYEDHTLRFFRYRAKGAFTKSAWGIMEPVDGEEVHVLDVLVIPLVAFDENGNRLGHGAGFYDRFLKDFKGLRIGVAHECQKVACVYEQAHDIPLDIILTEKHLYKRKM